MSEDLIEAMADLKAAMRKAIEAVPDYTIGDSDAQDAYFNEVVDAALTALGEAGYAVVKREASDADLVRVAKALGFYVEGNRISEAAKQQMRDAWTAMLSASQGWGG